MQQFTRRAFGALPALAAAPAFAQTRNKFAVVIANSDYDGDGKVDTSEPARAWAQERGYVGDLGNPWFDAVRVREALQRAGFAVEVFLNADRAMIQGAISNVFARAAAAGPTSSAVVYFAGHGVQIGGRNYLVASRARLIADQMPSATDIDRTRIALAIGAPVQEILMRAPRPAAPGYNLILLDACRDNPWEPQIRAAYEAQGRSYVGERGFGAMSVMTPRTVVSFSASPGQTAVDGIEGAGSPYSGAIVRGLTQPGATVDGLIAGIVGAVSTAAGGRQAPWSIGRLGDSTKI